MKLTLAAFLAVVFSLSVPLVHSSQRNERTGTVHCLDETLMDAGLLIKILPNTGLNSHLLATVSEETIAGPRFIETQKVGMQIRGERSEDRKAVFTGQDFYLEIDLGGGDEKEVLRPAVFSGRLEGAYYEGGHFEETPLSCQINVD
jgi:hypothetical protein